jgi:hypothetical protein
MNTSATARSGRRDRDPVACRGGVRSACNSVRMTTVTLGQSWSLSAGRHESAESAFVLVRALDVSSKLVVRGRVEPRTFRFSEGLSPLEPSGTANRASPVSHQKHLAVQQRSTATGTEVGTLRRT